MIDLDTCRGQQATRKVSIAKLQAGKEKGYRWYQVSANTAEEAEAVVKAGMDMIICDSPNVKRVREVDNTLLLTAMISSTDFETTDEILREAFQTLEQGADAIMTSHTLETVSALANEGVPVMGHLAPGRSTLIDDKVPAGFTGNDAWKLYQHFMCLEDAGALMVLAELIPAEVMEVITKRTKLITVSWGSGAEADVVYQSMDDICGKEPTLPARYAYHHFGVPNLKKLTFEERVEALMSFRKAVADREFPRHYETIGIAPQELDIFLKRFQPRTIDFPLY